jgi:tetratricopeptide (TPR) repeat protein
MTVMRLFPIIAVLALLVISEAVPAFAKAEIDQEEALTLQAAAASMKRDFRTAEMLYSRILSINGNNEEAYEQRAIARRELGNTQGMQQDASQAVALIDGGLRQNPNSANLYYKRSIADRLLKNFDDAERDLSQAIRLGKRGNFDNDWKAIALERKMAQ